MRIMFAGSPAIAVPVLKQIVERGFDLAAVLTNPDSARGRKSALLPTEVAAASLSLSPEVPVWKPERLGAGALPASLERAAAFRADLLVSFAYGKIFPRAFLDLFPLGGINIHPSLLPRHRGPTPIPAALLAGERESGVTIQKLAVKMDCGDILAQEVIPLDERETTETLSAKAAEAAARMLPPVLHALEEGTLEGQAQDEAAVTYCALLRREDGLIDWGKSAREIDAQVRAYTPWPLCRTSHAGQELYILAGQSVAAGGSRSPAGTVLGKDKRLGLLIQTGEGVYAASRLQYAARKALDWQAFLNGVRDFIGARLG